MHWEALLRAARLWPGSAEASPVLLARVSRRRRLGCARPATGAPTVWANISAPASAPVGLRPEDQRSATPPRPPIALMLRMRRAGRLNFAVSRSCAVLSVSLVKARRAGAGSSRACEEIRNELAPCRDALRADAGAGNAIPARRTALGRKDRIGARAGGQLAPDGIWCSGTRRSGYGRRHYIDA